MARSPLSAYVFVVVLVRRGFRYLLVQAGKGDSHGQWYLPAGAVEPGEDLVSAAVRKTKQAAGVDIEVTGIMAIDHMPRLPGWEFARWRFVVEARVLQASPSPRQEPNEETLGAAFFAQGEIGELRLRGEDVVRLISEHAGGAAVAPISVYRPGLA
ncbi:MAG: NUDIX domain-containing protein [Nannocystaceae bacterium]|nr:NUDIX domain-containing protein [Nannocystaceae bacterium]